MVEFGNVRIKKNHAIAAGIAIILTTGFVFGFALSGNSSDPEPWKRVSGVIGWTYFAAWSISFYPQVYLNWVRKSVVGMSFDFQLLNLVGFACYASYNVSYYWVHEIHVDYHHKHGFDKDIPVRINDVIFALHAELLTAITFAQIFFYERGDQRFHPVTLVAVLLFFIVFAAWLIYLAHEGGNYTKKTPWTWLDFFLGLSWVKLGISVVKYTPQVYLNYSRKRTTGWNIWNVLLDFTGGSLSIAQMIMDCVSQSDWSQVSGDPVKFGLGSCSMFFDIIFMIQHYILYADGNAQDVVCLPPPPHTHTTHHHHHHNPCNHRRTTRRSRPRRRAARRLVCSTSLSPTTSETEADEKEEEGEEEEEARRQSKKKGARGVGKKWWGGGQWGGRGGTDGTPTPPTQHPCPPPPPLTPFLQYLLLFFLL